MKQVKAKGQVFSIDLLFASTVFLFILVISITYSLQTANNIELIEKDNERQNTVILVTNSLLLNQGNPINWENLNDLNTVTSIGLINSRNEISVKKINKLIDLNSTNYETIKDLLGASKYDLKIELLDLETKQAIREFGLNPSDVNKSVSVVNRIALFEGNEVIVRVKVFK